VHRGEYGFWESWDEEYGDTGGNDGDNDFEIEEDEYDEVIEEEEFYCNVNWASIPPDEMPDNNINLNPTLVIDTNLIGEIDYKIWITYNSAPFSYGNPQTPSTMPSAPPVFELTSDYITVTENWNTNSNGQIQGGTLQLRSDFSPPDVEHGDIEGYVEISHPDIGGLGKAFFQDYTADPEEDARLGDYNDDGILNILDIVGILTQIILTGEGAGGLETWNDENSGNYSPQSDVSGDGIVNVLDIVAIINIILDGEG
jgi:hypothetical protein